MQSTLTDDDRARLTAIANQGHDRERISLIAAYWRDQDRSERSVPSIAYLHLGLLSGIGDRLLDRETELRTALEELVKLQAHYATLLNMHDGGQRHAFSSADEWIARLREVGDLKRTDPEPR